MNKKIVILFVLIILVIMFWWIFNLISRDGEFTKTSHVTAGIEHFEKRKAVFLGYNFSWKGIGKPIIEKIEFLKRDGTIVAKDENDFRIQPFIASTERIGVIDEEYVVNEGLDVDLIQVKGYQINKNFYLVLRVEFDGTNPDNDIKILRITYKKYGVTQYQNIPFDGGVIMDGWWSYYG
ncbi:hypothetical protein SAMN05877753_11080 [Bacillus oleivorans]|uniref:Uncharacterized protein n=1 Tax=Bacillus oleivorans TaxID=1448271 RepID=A0A285D4S0_9BACI|nr:hypothetical protein [Bacillus oleivorans]SNX74802.1 hypothetical protein SAMN05877753_11080 [Bacillus oleivorans]